MTLVGIGTQFFQGAGPNLTTRDVDYAQERVVIIRIHQQAQVGHHVFHFSPEKMRYHRSACRESDVLQFHLQQPGLELPR